MKCKCEDCDWSGDDSALAPIKRYHERVSPGEQAPAGQCPECGALAHVVAEAPRDPGYHVDRLGTYRRPRR